MFLCGGCSPLSTGAVLPDQMLFSNDQHCGAVNTFDLIQGWSEGNIVAIYLPCNYNPKNSI